MNHKMQPIPALRDYCGDGNPVIREVHDGMRWMGFLGRKRASVSYLAKLRSQGITRIAVEVAPGRNADFTIAELMPKTGLRG